MVQIDSKPTRELAQELLQDTADQMTLEDANLSFDFRADEVLVASSDLSGGLFSDSLEFSEVELHRGEVQHVLEYVDRAVAAKNDKYTQADGMLHTKDFQNLTGNELHEYVLNESLGRGESLEMAQTRADRAADVFEQIKETNPDTGFRADHLSDLSEQVENSLTDTQIATDYFDYGTKVDYTNRVDVAARTDARIEIQEALGGALEDRLDPAAQKAVEQFLAQHGKDLSVAKKISGNIIIEAGGDELSLVKSRGTNLGLGGGDYTVGSSNWFDQNKGRFNL